VECRAAVVELIGDKVVIHRGKPVHRYPPITQVEWR
jgi:hypothetical protein